MSFDIDTDEETNPDEIVIFKGEEAHIIKIINFVDTSDTKINERKN